MTTRRCLLACLFVSVASIEVLAKEEGHGMMCRASERFLPCGCQRTCTNPAPLCAGVCVPGCYCADGEVRNGTGHCVQIANCPPMELSKLQTSEPRRTENECPPDEEYRSCEPCNKTCDNPNPICPAQCARGCFCRDDLVRDKDGRCVKVTACSNLKKNESTNLVKPVTLQLTCGPHQDYNSCRSCEKTCSSATAICRLPCSAGCFCQEGYLKAPSGQCVKLEDCPKAEVTLGAVQEPTIEDCTSDEVYLSCGWCEPSCWEPRPECPRGVCTRGCLCRPPLLRHHSGHCVSQRDCTPQKCTDPNEEFVCRYGCEARCDYTKCTTRQRRCVLGCHCRLGLYRDFNGKCVPLESCENYIRLDNSTDGSNITDSNNTSHTSHFFNASATSDQSFGEVPKFFVGIANLPITLTLSEANDGPKSVFDLPSETYPGKKAFDRTISDDVYDAVKVYKELLKGPNLDKEAYVPFN